MAYKMKGFTYPGTSPLKGAKKQAKIAAAKAKKDEALLKTQEAMASEMKSTNILDSQGFSIQGGGVAPLKMTEEGETTDEDKDDAEYYGSEADKKANKPPKKSFKESFKGAMGTKMGEKVGDAIATAGINAIAGALTRPKKKKKTQGPDVSGFANIKMGRK